MHGENNLALVKFGIFFVLLLTRRRGMGFEFKFSFGRIGQYNKIKRLLTMKLGMIIDGMITSITVAQYIGL